MYLSWRKRDVCCQRYRRRSKSRNAPTGGQAWRARRYVEGTPVRRQFFGQERTRNPSVLQIDIKPKRILFDFAAHSIPDNGQGSREFAFDPTCSDCSESSQQPNKPNYHFALILERYYFFPFIPRNERDGWTSEKPSGNGTATTIQRS